MNDYKESFISFCPELPLGFFSTQHRGTWGPLRSRSLVSVPPEAAAETGLGYEWFVQEAIPGDRHCIDHVDLYVVSSTVLLSPSNVAPVPHLANANLEPTREAVVGIWLPSLRELNPP